MFFGRACWAFAHKSNMLMINIFDLLGMFTHPSPRTPLSRSTSNVMRGLLSTTHLAIRRQIAAYATIFAVDKPIFMACATDTVFP